MSSSSNINWVFSLFVCIVMAFSGSELTSLYLITTLMSLHSVASNFSKQLNLSDGNGYSAFNSDARTLQTIFAYNTLEAVEEIVRPTFACVWIVRYRIIWFNGLADSRRHII